LLYIYDLITHVHMKVYINPQLIRHSNYFLQTHKKLYLLNNSCETLDEEE